MEGSGSVLVDPQVRAALTRVRAGISTEADEATLRRAVCVAFDDGFEVGWLMFGDAVHANEPRERWRVAWSAARVAGGVEALTRQGRSDDEARVLLVEAAADVLRNERPRAWAVDNGGERHPLLHSRRAGCRYGPGPVESGLRAMVHGWPQPGTAARTCMLNAVGLGIGAAAARHDFDPRVTLRAWQGERDVSPLVPRLLMLAAALQIERDKLRRGTPWAADEAWAYGRVAQVAEWRRRLEAHREARRVRDDARAASVAWFAEIVEMAGAFYGTEVRVRPSTSPGLHVEYQILDGAAVARNVEAVRQAVREQSGAASTGGAS